MFLRASFSSSHFDISHDTIQSLLCHDSQRERRCQASETAEHD